MDSKWFWEEKQIALNERAFVVPIILDDVNLDNFPAFRRVQNINLINKEINDEAITEIANIINQREFLNN